MKFVEYVASRIRELRTNYGGPGISQEALAKSLGIATNTVSRWETGIYKPGLEDLDKLSRFFGVSVLTFFPPADAPGSSQMAALLRVASNLTEEDLAELHRYAEYRHARSLYKDETGRSVGRKRNVTS
jgi:transcriptional regulator with XRE-family HTH domain